MHIFKTQSNFEEIALQLKMIKFGQMADIFAETKIIEIFYKNLISPQFSFFSPILEFSKRRDSPYKWYA